MVVAIRLPPAAFASYIIESATRVARVTMSTF